MGRLISWMLPLLLLAATLVATHHFVPWAFEGATPPNSWWIRPLFLLVDIFLLVILTIISIRNLVRAFRAFRRRRGNFTHRERQHLQTQRTYADWWRRAAWMRSHLIQGLDLPQVESWPVASQRGEVFFERTTLNYARYYGHDYYSYFSSTKASGSPGFVLAALAIGAIAHSSAQRAAARQAAQQWREWQSTQILVSDRRLVVNANGQWLSFWYGGMTAVYPLVSQHSLVCEFEDAVPLLLTGPAVPSIALFPAHQIFGTEGLLHHPDIEPLDHPAPEPTLPRIP